MARNIGADGREVYRAVIVKTLRTGAQITEHEGPYASPGAARARVTFWTNRFAAYDDDSHAEGHVEQAHTIWVPFDGKEQRPAERAAAFIRAQAYRDAADDIDSGDDCGCGGCAECVAHAHANELRRRADELFLTAQEPNQ